MKEFAELMQIGIKKSCFIAVFERTFKISNKP